ncbi:hypothetical protein DSM104440_01913 [Usitatibacter palustris]|uniref:Uncharacterized protein n=2 Tax=Usitatibacter palustris TaxID=2732487 RepID=A0A6M4H648_9PROT|nr:hypothetical protein DSM104440_01913 [Usitatibacter palustris]
MIPGVVRVIDERISAITGLSEPIVEFQPLTVDELAMIGGGDVTVVIA